MGTRFRAAVLQQHHDPFVGLKAPQVKNTVIFAPVQSLDEGNYLAGLLNSSPLNYLATFSSVRAGKSFGSGGFLSRVRIDKYDPAMPAHAHLASCAAAATAAQAAEDTPALAVASIALNLAAASYWGLTSGELKEMASLLESLGSKIIDVHEDPELREDESD